MVPVNDAPVAQDDFIIIDEDTLAQIGVLANDSDVDGDTVSVDSVLQQPANGTLQINSQWDDQLHSARQLPRDRLVHVSHFRWQRWL